MPLKKHDCEWNMSIICTFEFAVLVTTYYLNQNKLHRMLSIGFRSLLLWASWKHSKPQSCTDMELNKTKLTCNIGKGGFDNIHLIKRDIALKLCNLCFIPWSHDSNWPNNSIQFNSIFNFSYYKAQKVQYQCKYIATIWVVEITKI